MKNLECSNCVIASSQNSNSFLELFDRMNPWRRRKNFKPMKLQNSLVDTKAFIKDSLRQCARLVKAFGTKLNLVPRAARTSPSKDSTARSDSRSYLDFDWPQDIQIRTDLIGL